jgi:hypothetical protein
LWFQRLTFFSLNDKFVTHGAFQKVKPGGLARLFSFITLWGLTWF